MHFHFDLRRNLGIATSWHISRGIFICFFPLSTAWALLVYIFALFGLFILFIGGAIPASRTLITNFFISLGPALSMICHFSCPSLMYRCEWHGLIDFLHDLSVYALFLFSVPLAGAFGLILFRPRWLALGSFFFHICDMPVYLFCVACVSSLLRWCGPRQ
jgi:hypothetical protein